MLRKFGLLLAVLVLAFGVVACGDDEEEPAGGGTTTEETTDDSGGGTTEDTTEEDSTEEDSGGSDVPDAQIEAAVEQCKSAIDAQPQLSEDVKSDLAELCEKAAEGDAEEVQEASVEVCKKIVEESVPESAGDARDQALAACESAAP